MPFFSTWGDPGEGPQRQIERLQWLTARIIRGQSLLRFIQHMYDTCNAEELKDAVAMREEALVTEITEVILYVRESLAAFAASPQPPNQLPTVALESGQARTSGSTSTPESEGLFRRTFAKLRAQLRQEDNQETADQLVFASTQCTLLELEKKQRMLEEKTKQRLEQHKRRHLKATANHQEAHQENAGQLASASVQHTLPELEKEERTLDAKTKQRRKHKHRYPEVLHSHPTRPGLVDSLSRPGISSPPNDSQYIHFELKMENEHEGLRCAHRDNDQGDKDRDPSLIHVFFPTMLALWGLFYAAGNDAWTSLVDAFFFLTTVTVIFIAFLFIHKRVYGYWPFE